MITLMAGAHADEPVGPFNLYCLLRALSQNNAKLCTKQRLQVSVFHINEKLTVANPQLNSDEFIDLMLDLKFWLCQSIPESFIDKQVEAWQDDFLLNDIHEIHLCLAPHINPLGALKNRVWWSEYCNHQLMNEDSFKDSWESLSPLSIYLQERVRELPGQDIEFGFSLKNENNIRKEPWELSQFWKKKVVQDSSSSKMNFHLSLHGMGFSAGPWFLVEKEWNTLKRLEKLKVNLTRSVLDSGYKLHDMERLGEKGFWRLDKGFCSRPDSASMKQYFIDLGDQDMANKFQLSSMEYRRTTQVEDIYTAVSEMPLYTLAGVGDILGPPDMKAEFFKLKISEWSLEMSMVLAKDKLKLCQSIAKEAWEEGIRVMPLADQLKFQRDLFIESYLLHCK